MPRHIKCRRCGYGWGVPDREQDTKCPGCGKKIHVPARDFKEDYSRWHRGHDPRPRARNNPTILVGKHSRKETKS